MKSIDVVPTWYWPDGVPRYLTPPRSTIYKAAVERWARRTPDNIALDEDAVRIDYRTFKRRVRNASVRIQQTLDGRYDDNRAMRVAVAASQGINGAVAILGALDAGAATF